ncbi:MAG: Chromate transporter [Clostridiales bacterium]|jgi:chromate transporter|nr:Chromate transporter [Clostridiales bacterium]
MIYIKLMWVFFKIGLFSFGGGYVMIPLIQKEIEANGWVDPREFADIVAISQMTPGPLAVNAATYIGVKTAGFWGSFFATLGVSLPSFIIILLIARFIAQFKDNKNVESVLKGIRPVTIGLMASAVLFFAEMSIFTAELPFIRWKEIVSNTISELITKTGVNFGALLIFVLILVGVKKFKLHPILAVVCSAVLGIFLI